MATIDSLDLATLTNNPQSIAEALEDVLETSSGSIASLKSSAQTDHDAIEDLLTSAQSDHDAIEDLLGDLDVEHYYANSGLSNSFIAYDASGTTSTEAGVRVQRFGKLYIAHLCVQKESAGNPVYSIEVLDLGNNIKHPDNLLFMGHQNIKFGNNTDDSAYSTYIDTNGKLGVRGTNDLGGSFFVIGNFIGIDVS